RGIPVVTDRAEVAEQLGLGLCGCNRSFGSTGGGVAVDSRRRRGSAQRNVRQHRDGIDYMLRLLGDDAVVDAVLWIEPEVRLQQRSAGERGQHARGDLLLRDAE